MSGTWQRIELHSPRVVRKTLGNTEARMPGEAKTIQ
jgi:hypothetical protein